jgi:hypothetical protein
MSEMLNTSVGVFEIGWGYERTGETWGGAWIEIDSDGGLADNPWIIEVASPEDVAAALTEAGVPRDEADELAGPLWERRWRGPAASGAGDA